MFDAQPPDWFPLVLHDGLVDLVSQPSSFEAQDMDIEREVMNRIHDFNPEQVGSELSPLDSPSE